MGAHLSTPVQRLDTRRRIIEATLRLSALIGHRKTTVADIARELSMSPANIYRFFRSKRAIDEAVVGELLAETLVRAIDAARAAGTAIERLRGVLQAIERSHAGRLASEKKLYDLVIAASQESWAIVGEYQHRMTRIASWVISSGQARGELRGGDPTAFARCVLATMEGHSHLKPASACRARPTTDQMIEFCVSAIGAASPTSDMPVQRRLYALRATVEDLIAPNPPRRQPERN